ncbi:hypothetical protein AC249_AIPGENE22806 [Exaiptasia diaphana]|nr:hypothetical protein AC249_AIPGENE22806 [Exaiptasia diaphana]
MANKLLIIRTYRQFGGRAWLHYDQDFREFASASNLTDWSKLNPELYNFHTAGSAPRLSSSTICISWNKGSCSSPYTPCRYAHKCTKCAGPHRASECRRDDSRQVERKSSSHPDSPKQASLPSKRVGRVSSLKESTSIGEEEKKKIKMVLKNEYMSSDESVAESEEEANSSDSESEMTPVRKTRYFKIRRLTWRSQELDSIFKKLDKRVKRRRTSKGSSMVLERREGQPSRRQPPHDAPAWAISRN